MENLYRATGDEADKARMMAEAKFLRAFSIQNLSDVLEVLLY